MKGDSESTRGNDPEDDPDPDPVDDWPLKYAQWESVQSSTTRLRTKAGRFRPPVPCRLPPINKIIRNRRRFAQRISFRACANTPSNLVSNGLNNHEQISLEPSPNTLPNSQPGDEGDGIQVVPNGSTDSDPLMFENQSPVGQISTCEVCDVTTMFRTRWALEEQIWTTFERFRAAAAAGCQCCDMIVDATKVWFSSMQPRTRPGSQLSLDGAELSFSSYNTQNFQLPLDPSEPLCPVLIVGWRIGDNNTVKQEVTLEVFQPHGKEPSSLDIASSYRFSHRHLPSGDTASLQAFTCLENWIQVCTKSHRLCDENSGGDYVPKRILQITHDQVILREDLVPQIRYACLSHCWGPEGVELKLQRDTLKMFKEGIQQSDLPKTFRDALTICSRLGIAYLWIDALCIIQDSIEDWSEAAANMADVYASAFLTIAATASENSNGGCFSESFTNFKPQKLKRSILYVSEHNIRDYSIRNGQYRQILSDWPLSKRAWVYQERRLSTRIVHYTDTELFWECHSMFKSESGEIDQDWSQKSCKWKYTHEVPFKFPIADSVDEWRAAIDDYSWLGLTFPKDRLPALAAVVKRMMQTRSNDRYIAGLWENSLLEDLKWRAVHYSTGQRSSLEVPTWSWASIEFAVNHDFKHDYINSTLWRGEANATLTVVGPVQLGKVSNAAILLKSRTYTGKVQWKRPTIAGDLVSFDVEPEWCYLKKLGFSGRLWPDYDILSGPNPVQTAETVEVVLVDWKRPRLIHGEYCMNSTGMALRRVSENEFERIGLCDFNYAWTLRTVRCRATVKDNFFWRCYKGFMHSLPVREFKII